MIERVTNCCCIDRRRHNGRSLSNDDFIFGFNAIKIHLNFDRFGVETMRLQSANPAECIWFLDIDLCIAQNPW